MQVLRRAVDAAQAFDDPRRLVSAGEAAVYLGDLPAAIDFLGRAARAVRAGGAVGALPLALGLLAAYEGIDGRLASAAANASEGLDLSRDTGQENSAAYHLAILARVEALRGREQECRAHAAEAFELASAHGLHFQAATATWAIGDLELALGRPAEALSRLESLATVAPGAAHPMTALCTTADFVEAAVRADRSSVAEPGVERFAEWADATGSPWALALASRFRAQLSSGEAAKRSFEAARDLHAASGRSFEGARTELAYGEFLRREGGRREAREHLRSALDVFEQVGAAPYGERARAELRASGESARSRDPSTIDELTPQELQIARFVAEGATNRQVAAQLFLSPRTIDYHLRNIFRKLGISSRNELGRLLLERGAEPTAAGAPAAPVGA
jgi:ATP/maltotriose-dependent transcriptional regulator MalT